MKSLEEKFYEYLSKNHPMIPDWFKTISSDLSKIAIEHMTSGDCQWKGKSFNAMEKEIKELRKFQGIICDRFQALLKENKVLELENTTQANIIENLNRTIQIQIADGYKLVQDTAKIITNLQGKNNH